MITFTSECRFTRISSDNVQFFQFKAEVSLKGAGSRVRPWDNVVVLKLVDGVNPPKQLN